MILIFSDFLMKALNVDTPQYMFKNYGELGKTTGSNLKTQKLPVHLEVCVVIRLNMPLINNNDKFSWADVSF